MTTPSHYSNLALVRARKPNASALKAEADATRQTEAKIKRAIDRTAHLLDQRVERIEEQTLTLMGEAGLEKLTGNKVTFSMRANAPSLVVEDQSQIPSEYIRTKSTTEPNKVAIKVALDRGVEIGGVRLVQSISLIRR
jgi:hypothetical protein